MTPLDEAAQQHVITARAAAGMCDTGEMAATMEQAREAMQALYEVHVPGEADCHFWLTDAEAAKWRSDGCTLTPCHCGQMDFSLCNDAALSADADQYEDWLHWRWTCGIGKY